MSSERETNEKVNSVQPEEAMGEFNSAMDYMKTAKDLPQDDTADVKNAVESAMSDEFLDNFFDEQSTENEPVAKQAEAAENVGKEENTSEKTVLNPPGDIEEASPEKAEKEKIAEEPEDDKVSAESDIVSEFAPTPITIPKYDKEKEQKRAVKENEKTQKRNSKKSKVRREKLYRAVFVTRTVLLFILTVCVIATILFSLLVKVNTTEYAMETAIRKSEPGRYIIGKIPDKAKANLKLEDSSSRAGLIDIVRDNKVAGMTVAYSDIEREILNSSYPRFLAGIANDIVDFYLFGTPYKGITEKDVAELISSNEGQIRTVTGRSLGETAGMDFAKEIKKSRAFKEISEENVMSQSKNHDAKTTALLFSTMLLVCLVVALILMIIITLIACKGFAHKMIGWSTIIAGVLVGAIGYFTGSLFNASSEFVKCVVDVLVKSFNASALVWGGVTVVVGVIVMIIGKALSEGYDEDDDDYEDEEDYIDEIEQVSTAQ